MSLPTIADHAMMARAARDTAEAFAAAGDADMARVYAQYAAEHFHGARIAARVPASATAQEGKTP